MKNIAAYFFVIIISWMFYFPLSFLFLPRGMNSKMLMAAVGLCIILFNLIKQHGEFKIKRELIWMSIIAIFFSIISFYSVTTNNTEETDYTTYIVSMYVWMAAAYTSTRAIKLVHGRVSLDLVCNYIIALCVCQCIVALSMSMFPPIKTFFGHFIPISENSIAWESRLYGLGASSDTGGVHFCVGLVAAAFMLCQEKQSEKKLILYALSFLLITLIGNMMSRTTSIGALIGIVYIVYKTKFWKLHLDSSSLKTISAFIVIAIVLIPIVTIIYQHSMEIQKLARFGYEGFFNLFEHGEFRINTGSTLTSMWKIWPDNLHTWLIGDGHFLDPDDPKKYYMGTDVGYARFVFYCGLSGIITFSSLFLYLFYTLSKNNPEYIGLFVMLIILVFVIWIKVSTDLLFAFAFYFFAQDNKDDELMELDENNI